MMQKIIVLLFVVLVLGAGVWFFFLRQEPERIIDRPTAGETIIAFGDSLVEGVGASPGSDMVSLLSSRVGQPGICKNGRAYSPSVAGDAPIKRDWSIKKVVV